MIADVRNVSQGRLGGLMNYIYNEQKDARVVDSACFDHDQKQATKEIRDAMNGRPEIKRPLMHAILSVDAHEAMEVDKWEEIAQQYMERMGYKTCPYVAVRHKDTDHDHIHIVASRVSDHDRSLVSDSFDYYRAQEVVREIERKHDLTPVLSSWEQDKDRARPLQQGEWHREIREGKTTQRKQMIEAIAQEKETARDMPDFKARLAARNVQMIPHVSKSTRRVVGVYFEHDGVKVAGSKLHRSYSWNKLEKELVYEHARDFKTITRVPEPVPQRPKAESSIAVEQAPQTSQDPSLARASEQLNEQENSRPKDEIKKAQGVVDKQVSAPISIVPERHPSVPERTNEPMADRIPVELPQQEPQAQVQKQEQVFVPERLQSPTSSSPQTVEAGRDISVESTRHAALQEPVSPVTTGPSPEEEKKQAVEKIKQALKTAQWKDGWQAWSASMKAQGVRPVPKVMVSDEQKVTGIYFEAGNKLYPGSQVDRQASIGGLSKRLGAFDPEGGQDVFERIYVPGVGLKDATWKKPMVQTQAPTAQQSAQKVQPVLARASQVEVKQSTPVSRPTQTRPSPVSEPTRSSLESKQKSVQPEIEKTLDVPTPGAVQSSHVPPTPERSTQRDRAQTDRQVQTSEKTPEHSKVSSTPSIMLNPHEEVLRPGVKLDASVLQKACKKHGVALGVAKDRNSSQPIYVCPRTVALKGMEMRVLMAKDRSLVLVPEGPTIKKMVGKSIRLGDALKAHDQEVRIEQATRTPTKVQTPQTQPAVQPQVQTAKHTPAMLHPQQEVLRVGDKLDAAVLYKACQAHGVALGVAKDRNSPQVIHVCPRTVEFKGEEMRILMAKDRSLVLVPEGPTIKKMVGKSIRLGDALKAHDHEMSEKARTRLGQAPKQVLTQAKSQQMQKDSKPSQVAPSEPTRSVQQITQKQSVAEWVQVAKDKSGRQISVLPPERRVTGKVLSQTLSLKEGDFHVVERFNKSLTLVPFDPALDRLVGQKVDVHRQQSGELTIKLHDLKMSKDRSK